MSPTNRIGTTTGVLLAVLLAACSGAAVEMPTGVASRTPESAPTAPTAPSATSGPTAPATEAPSLPAEPQPGEAPIGPTERATVVRIVDGDTIVVDRGKGKEKVRYIGMDTPESVKPGTPVQFMAKEASAANAALVGGKDVWLERDVSEVDRYGRLLRYVWLKDPSMTSGWLLVNLVLVVRGYAQVDTFPPDVRYVDQFTAAQRGAREQSLGLWSEDGASDPSGSPAATAGGARAGCDPAYPGVCIPPPPPDLDCGDITFRRFEVLPPDPHHFDGDGNGIGCESG